MPAYYALNYTGIFNRGITTVIATYLSCVAFFYMATVKILASIVV